MASAADQQVMRDGAAGPVGGRGVVMPTAVVPVARVAGVAFAGAVVCVAVAGGLLVLSGRGSVLDVLAAFACVLGGLVVGMIPLLALSGKPAVTVASGVMFGGFAGGLVSVALAAAAFVGLGLDGSGFWFAFLAGAAGALVGKIAGVLPSLRDAGVSMEAGS